LRPEAAFSRALSVEKIIVVVHSSLLPGWAQSDEKYGITKDKKSPNRPTAEVNADKKSILHNSFASKCKHEGQHERVVCI
jgi:hypothetical protein